MSKHHSPPTLTAQTSSPRAIPIKRAHDLPGDECSAALHAWLDTFTPKNIPLERWTEIRTFVLDAVRRSVPEPTTRDAYYNYIQPVAGLVEWAHHTARLPLEADRIFTKDNIEFWIAQKSMTAARAKSFRARLCHVGRTVTTKTPWEPRQKPYARTDRATPYDERDIRSLLRQADHQPTRTRVHVNRAFVYFGLGVGAEGSSISRLLGRDIRADPYGVHVRLESPDRWVTCRRPYEAAISALVKACGPDDHVLGKPGRYESMFSRLHRDSDEVHLNMARLRSTYVVDLIAHGVPLHVLLAALGLKSSDGLASFLQWIPEPDADHMAGLLRGDLR